MKPLYNEKLHDLYTSLNIVRVIKSRRMRLAGHVVRMGEERGVYGRIILGWLFRKWDGGVWSGLGWLRIETSGGKL
jgi:hypothetical protein